MRLDSLTHKEVPADSILKEIGVPKGERQVIMEFLPLIPVALWAGGAAWTAYDTYQAKKAYDRGEITKAQLAQRVGTDVAIGIAGGVLGKAVGAGWKVGKRIFKSKKAAKEAQKATADIPTPKDVTVPTGINTVANATTTTAKTSSKKAVQTAKPGDTIKTDKGEFLAGVDGKATTTRVSAPNASSIKDQILKIANPDSSTAVAVVKQTDDVASTVATQTAKATDDAAEIAAKRNNAIAGGPDFARNYVRNTALDRMKDLPAAGQKSFIKSLEKSHPGIAKELGVDKILAPATSTATKTVTKTTSTGITRAQRNAISNMDNVPTSSATRNSASGTGASVVAKTGDDVTSTVAKKVDNVTPTTSVVAKTGDDVAATGAKKADNLTPTTSVVAKTGDDVAAATAKKADKPNAKQRAKAKMRGYFSNLNKGNYWDTDLSSVAQKYGSF
jgi:hypothetical protein